MKNLSLGKKIKAIRQSKGLSQEDMAYELGLSLASYSRIERDITDTTYSTLEKICKILKVSVLDIISHGTEHLTEGKYKKLYEDQDKVLRKFEKEIREKDKEIISLQKKLLKVNKKISKE